MIEICCFMKYRFTLGRSPDCVLRRKWAALQHFPNGQVGTHACPRLSSVGSCIRVRRLRTGVDDTGPDSGPDRPAPTGPSPARTGP